MKHISCIEGIDNLRAIIRSELQDYGIKVPKGKKARRHHGGAAKDHGKSVGIFGNYLANVPCVYVRDCGYVSKFLVDAAGFITEHIEQEGIFRKSGSVSRQKELKQELEEGKGLTGANVYDVTTLVKQFFRELPEPLFSSVYHDTFVRCYQIEDAELATKAILLLCLLLPGEHVSTLQFILQLLAKVSTMSDKNKMDVTNLAVVLAPNIMHMNRNSEKMNSNEEKLLQVQTSVVELLIQNAGLVGMVDNELVGKTAFMSEVFSTDDELDASEDNLEDSKDTRKKEKKRKRSGSFQGFVSSIAQSITKWRRSTDGKTNTSNLSQASNASKISNQGRGNLSTKSDDLLNCPLNNEVYQFSVTEATPVVRRKKGGNTESRAFSASKKKAILQQLPQQAALASTPFTPASSMKRMDINSTRRMVGDTPGIPLRPGHNTPRHAMKTPRKKLALFSPGSSMKKNRYSNTNLSVQSTGKKPSKTKGIFRRLSGSKGDQFPAPTPQTTHQATAQIGQRLASPTATGNGSVLDNSDFKNTCKASDHTISDESPIAAIMHNSNLSGSLCEQSVISAPGDTMSLNEGFIMNADDRDNDISMYGDLDNTESRSTGECVSLDLVQRASRSDTTLNDQTYDTPSMLSAHHRSFSAEGNLDGSLRRANLRRGQPNSIKAGLLQGSQNEVQKLRRSFGLDKSDIGYPIPVSVPSLGDHDVSCLDSTIDHMRSNDGSSIRSRLENQQSENDSTESPGSVSQCRHQSSSSSVSNQTVTNSSTGDGMGTGYGSDDQSETGFSTISGGTAIFRPKPIVYPTQVDLVNAKCSEFVNTSEAPVKKLSEQKAESVDSLFSEGSSTSPAISNHKEMTRSISADSGKGSMLDELMNEDQIQAAMKQNIQTKEAESKLEETFTNLGSAVKSKKSVSTQDLQYETKTSTPALVTRSKSLLDSSMTRRNNIKPNLQISAETHKLLARAGYIRDQKPPTKEKEDFFVSGTIIKPVTLEEKEIKCPVVETDKVMPKPDPPVKAVEKRDNETQQDATESSPAMDETNVPEVEIMDETIPTEEDFLAFPTDQDFAVPTAIPTIKQSTDLVNPRRESILALREKNAGKVANNVKQFDKIYVKKKTSPLRFSQSTSRKCMSPITIPSIFADEKLSFGTARVPISTQLIRSSFSETKAKNETETNKSFLLKRKPSIYYAKDNDGNARYNSSAGQQGSNRLHCTIPEETTPESPSEDGSKKQADNPAPKVNLFNNLSTLDGQYVDLNQSLQATIDKVCTPLSEKIYQDGDINNSVNKENEISRGLDDSFNFTAVSKMPTIKPSILSTPLFAETLTLRTASGKTPIELLKTSKSPRSPIKTLKRLGSPRSPRCRSGHSPNRVLTKRPRLTTVLISEMDELKNL